MLKAFFEKHWLLKKSILLCACLMLCNYFVVPLTLVPFLFVPRNVYVDLSSWLLVSPDPFQKQGYGVPPNISKGILKVHFSGKKDLKYGQADIAACYYLGRYYDRYFFSTDWEKRVVLLDFTYKEDFANIHYIDQSQDERYTCPLTRFQRRFIRTAKDPGDFTYIVINHVLFAYKNWKVFYFIATN